MKKIARIVNDDQATPGTSDSLIYLDFYFLGAEKKNFCIFIYQFWPKNPYPKQGPQRKNC